MTRDLLPPVIRVSARTGPGRAVVSQPVFGHLVGGGGPGGGPGVYLVHLLVTDPFRLANRIKKYFTNAILHFVQSFFIAPENAKNKQCGLL